MSGPISFELTPIGKLFFASLVSWIAHDTSLNWKLRGKPDQVRAMAKAVVQSKLFQAELGKPGATVETVIKKLNLKNLTAAEFEELTGIRFPV